MSRAEAVVGQHNLPEDLSSLIGRERDLAEVSGPVGSHRVVTLVGAGGVGKTRLALGFARAAVVDFPDGIWLEELGSLTDAGLVPELLPRRNRHPTSPAGDRDVDRGSRHGSCSSAIISVSPMRRFDRPRVASWATSRLRGVRSLRCEPSRDANLMCTRAASSLRARLNWGFFH